MDIPKMEQPKPSAPLPSGASSGAAAVPPKPSKGNDAVMAFSSGGESGGGLRVSLMPSLQGDGEAMDLRRSIVILLLVLVVETLLLGTAYFFVMQKESRLKAGQSALMTELDSVRAEIRDAEAEAQGMVEFNRQTAAAHKLLDDHVYWTSAFGFLEARTKRSVTYRNFSGDASSGTISMDAIGETYRDVAEQIVILSDDPMVRSLRTSAAAAAIDAVGEVQGVTFSVVMTLDPAVWKKSDFTPPPQPVVSNDEGGILPVEDQLNAVPQPVTPVTRDLVDPGADGGATSFDSLFEGDEAPLTQ